MPTTTSSEARRQPLMLPKSYSAASKTCTEEALLGQNPYTGKQLINNTIRLLLTMGLYIRAFKDWDQLAEAAKMWIELCRLIQEAFERQLNVTAPTAGHQGYAPALPFQQNVFGSLANNNSDEDSTKNRQDTDGGAGISKSADGNHHRQLIPTNGPLHSDTGPPARSPPSKSASNDEADGSSVVQSK